MVQPISRGTETREQWLGRAIEMMRPEFAAAGAPLPENLAVSCSWPSGNPRTVIGECWVAEASSRGYVEVFISPVLDQVAGIQCAGHAEPRAGARGRAPRPGRYAGWLHE